MTQECTSSATASSILCSQTGYTYYAFVSYSHKDEKWSKWIQNALEHYRLPAVVRKEVGKPLPRKIHPVFRDDTDLGPGRLEDELQQELEQSQFLIVVCSPNSAKPNAEGKHWVNKEVSRFCAMGRVDRVIPVIVEGTAATAFCPKIAEEGLLGLDATKQPKARILNDLVAKILGLRPDELWRREERRLRTKRRLQGCLGTLAAAFIALGSYIGVDCTRTVKNYYADYVDSFGLPEGIFPLGKKELERRHHHYRFEYHGIQFKESPHADSAAWSIWNALGYRRRLVRVVQANSHGYPCKWDHVVFGDRPQIQDFDYDSNGRLCEIRQKRFKDIGQNPHLDTRIELYNDEDITNGLLKFYSQDNQRSIEYSKSSYIPMQNNDGTLPADNNLPIDKWRTTKSEIVQHAVFRDNKGRISRRIFLNSSFANVRNGEGIYGTEYKYDQHGRPSEQWNLIRDGEELVRCSSQQRNAGRRFTYSGRNMCKLEYVDEKGLPLHGTLECMASIAWGFDKFDNEIESWALDAMDMKVRSPNGCAGLRAAFDKHGNKIKAVCLNIANEPMLSSDGFAFWVAEYDQYGRLIKQSYFGIDGEPVRNQKGYAEIRIAYDRRGEAESVSFFGEDGKPTVDLEGIAQIHWEYDRHGNKITQLNLGVDGKPTNSIRGIAKAHVQYDKHDNAILESYFDSKGDLLYGIHREYDYDFARGNMTKESYFDADGNPMMDENGFASMSMEYNEQGLLTKQKYLGRQGSSLDSKQHVCEMRLDYDKRGNLTQLSSFDAKGAPMATQHGFSSLHMAYDQYGNLIQVSFFGVDNTPFLVNESFASCKLENDKYGNTTNILYFGADGSPIIQSDIVSVVKILPLSPAATLDIQEGDIWCQLGSYSILDAKNITDAVDASQATMNTEKELIVARKVGGKYEIHSFHFPIGLMGIRFESKTICDKDKLFDAYKRYLNKNHLGQ